MPTPPDDVLKLVAAMTLDSDSAAELARKKWDKDTRTPEERKAIGQIRSIPTPCPKCACPCPTARQARVHCRKLKNPRKSATNKYKL